MSEHSQSGWGVIGWGEMTAPPWITSRSTGPTDYKSCRSSLEAAGHVAVDRPLFQTLRVPVEAFGTGI